MAIPHGYVQYIAFSSFMNVNLSSLIEFCLFGFCSQVVLLQCFPAHMVTDTVLVNFIC